MSAHAIKHFDVLNFVNKSKELGVDEKVAIFQARQIEQVSNDFSEVVEQQRQLINEQTVKLSGLEAKELSTKGDVRESELRLQKEIKETELKLKTDIEMLRSELKTDIKNLEIKLLIIYGGGFLVLFGALAKGFHWF